MMTRTLSLLALIITWLPAQTTLQVPASFPTIQAAINAALPGDTVQIAAGTYFERIDFSGKLITVRGAGMGLTILDGQSLGPVVKVRSGEPVGTALEDLTVRNGIADIVSTAFGDPGHGVGGGISVVRPYPIPQAPSLAVRRCRVENCINTGLVFEIVGTIAVEDCEIVNNVGNPGASALYGPPGGMELRGVFNTATMSRCLVANNIGGVGGVFSAAADFRMLDCIVRDNQGGHIGGVKIETPTTSRVERCVILRNQVLAPGTSIGGGLSIVVGGVTVRDCIIADNSGAAFGGGLGVSYSYPPNVDIDGCTIVNNTATNHGGGAYFGSGLVTMRNCIVRDNVGGPTQITVDSCPELRLEHCNLPTSGVAFLVHTWTILTQINSVTANPLFVDPANGDYHLSLASPCIDAGTPAVAATSLLDVDGDPRQIFAAPDIGADEVASVALDPVAAGRVGENAGGPYDVLEVNGSSGGLARRVIGSVGTAATVTLLQPPNVTNPANFVIFGLLDEPRLDFVTTVPLGVGPMSFAPCPLLPFYFPYVFTFTNNFGADLCGQLVASTPTPWTSPPGPVIPFPLTLSLQGVIEEAPGVYVPTNLVIYELQ